MLGLKAESNPERMDSGFAASTYRYRAAGKQYVVVDNKHNELRYMWLLESFVR